MSEEGRLLSQAEKEALMRGDLKEAGLDTEEQSKEEKQEEETQEDKKEEKQEGSTEKKEEEKREEPPEFNLSAFNKKFEKEIEDEESLKSLFEKAEKYDATKTSYDEQAQKLLEYQNIAEKLDPMSNFLNEDEYKRQQLLIKDGGKFNEDAIKALSVLTPSKVKELSDVDALKTQLMIDKGVTGKEAEAYLSSKYEGFNSEDIGEDVAAVMKVDAVDARRDVSKLYDGIDIPTKTDYEAARTQLKESWNEPIPALVKSIDKIQVAEGLDFVVTDEMKKGLEESTLSWVMSKQIKPSEEAGALITGHLKDQIIINNMDQFVKSIMSDLEEKFKEGERARTHNDKSLNDDTRSDHTEEDNDAKMSRLL
jgi:hypothetical protein